MLILLALLFSLTTHAFNCGPGGNLNGDSLLTIVNKDSKNQLSSTYEPRDLEPIPKEFIHENYQDAKQSLRSEALRAYIAMAIDAKRNFAPFYIRSSYRSFKDQCETFENKKRKWINHFNDRVLGINYAKKSSAEPGRSQHQLGTTVDIVFGPKYDFVMQMDLSRQMVWLSFNAHKYGFVMSYPYADDDHDKNGFNKRTGYYYEPWHWRYIGPKHAKEMRSRGLILDEYLRQK